MSIKSHILGTSLVEFALGGGVAKVQEVILGETATLSAGTPIVGIETIDAPPGEPPTIKSKTGPVRVTPHALGRYHLRVRTQDGIDSDVSFCVCEPACLDRIPDEQKTGGKAINKRSVLRSVALYHQTFNGLLSELIPINLRSHGC